MAQKVEFFADLDENRPLHQLKLEPDKTESDASCIITGDVNHKAARL